MGRMVEQAVDGLPEIYRAVLILREVEGMSTTEAAAVLSVEPEVVKTRLHRARSALRSAVERRVGEQMKTAYTFGNERCRCASKVASRGIAPSSRCSRPPPTMVWKMASLRCVTASISITCRSARSP